MHKTITAKSLKTIMKDTDVMLIDVREPDEFEASHIEGSINMPLDLLGFRLNEIPKDKHIITICVMGVRSGIAAEQLEEKGYNVHSLTGGMIEWNAE